MRGTLHEHLAAARRLLADAGWRADVAALDVEVLARHVLGWDRARLLASGRDPAPPDFPARLEPLIARRLLREPVALITGRREFWGLDFEVTPATLVPRPETEFIVEEALCWLPEDRPATVLDIGTGSGCLAVSIAQERATARIVATDISLDALLVARRNAAAHQVGDRVGFVCTDLAAGLGVLADVIVANPPYVPEREAPGLPADVLRYEPSSALFAGRDGMRVLRRLFATAPDHLAPGGVLIVEFGYGQEDDVREAAAQAGWRVQRMIADLQDIPRTIVLRR